MSGANTTSIFITTRDILMFFAWVPKTLTLTT